ncbi:MAG: hypothetical protein U0840_02685 [Gemmataceae bacterium]
MSDLKAAEKARQQAMRQREKARQELLARFETLVQDPAHETQLLAEKATWKKQFDWPALEPAVQVEGVHLSAVLTRAMIVAFPAANVTPEVCLVMAQQLGQVVRAGGIPELDGMPMWFTLDARSRLEFVCQSVNLVRVYLQSEEVVKDSEPGSEDGYLSLSGVLVGFGLIAGVGYLVGRVNGAWIAAGLWAAVLVWRIGVTVYHQPVREANADQTSGGSVEDRK